MRKTLLDMYHDLRESGSTSDFPNLLGTSMYKVLLDKFKGVSSPWPQYCMVSALSDFKAHDRIIVSEAPDLLEIEELGPYTDSKLAEYKYQLQAKTVGRMFSISRQTVINDDLGAMKRQPERFGRASARTLCKGIVNAIEGDHKTYDGASLFAVAHANYGNTALANTAAGAEAVANGILSVEKATDPDTGEIMGLRAKYLVVPVALKIIGGQLLMSATIQPVSTSGGGTINALAQLELLVEPFLTSSTGWYVMASPEDCPVIDVGFLNGKETPDLLVKRADTINLAGGEDPYGYEFDDIWYKVRHDFGIALAYFQGIYRGKA